MAACYASVEQALAFAYGMEARVVCKLSWGLGRGGTGGDPYARHAEAAMVIALTRRTLKGVVRAAVEAAHTVPAERWLRARKQAACACLARHTRGPMWPNRFYVLDVAREWAGLRRDHDDAWWAEHLGLSERRLRQLKHGRRDRGTFGLMGQLDRHYESGVAALREPMIARGYISE